jgi:hypothetical protein
MANQAKPLRGVTPSRRSKVPGGRRGWFTNRAMAHVRTPGGPTSPTQRLFRDARSSPNLCARPSLTRSNRRGTGPVCPVVWEGWRREASPYRDQSLAGLNRNSHIPADALYKHFPIAAERRFCRYVQTGARTKRSASHPLNSTAGARPDAEPKRSGTCARTSGSIA